MIRIAEERDVAEILSIYAPYVQNTTYSFEYDVPRLEAFLERFRTITTRFPWIVWEEEGKILGYAYGSEPFARAAYRWSCESSVYLRPEARGRGIGRALYTALEQILAFQGYVVNYAIVTSENSASRAFHEKLGYRTAGELSGCAFKFGKRLGIVWMEKEIKTCEIPSEFPDTWPLVRQDAEKVSYILDILSLF